MRETIHNRRQRKRGQMNARRIWLKAIAICAATGLALAIASVDNDAAAEFGDVVLNNYADDAGMRPVVFPHWFHRIRFRCNTCHGDLGFQFKAGADEINMVKIIDGQYCGACHNGDIAWSIENCDLCHSGVAGTPTHVHHSTILKPAVAPLEDTTTQPDNVNGEDN